MTQKNQALLNLLRQKPYVMSEPSLLVEAHLVRLVAGEDLSSRLFLTLDSEGQELCLRHDYTLPLTLEFLASGAKTADFSYYGKVFRHREGESGEFLQAGVESFGRQDKAICEAEIVNMALACVKNYTSSALTIEMGDMSLILSLIDALGFSKAWNARLKRDFRRGKQSQKPNNSHSYSGLLTALEGTNPKAAKELVSDLLSIAGISTFGGRTIGEISERFLEQASLQSDESLDEKLAVISQALALEGKPLMVLEGFETIAKTAGLSIDLTNHRARHALLKDENITLKTAFAREPDYYDGLVFEIYDANRRVEKRLAGGGRYDRMTQILSSKPTIPAIGFSLWMEGLTQLEAQNA